MKHLVTLRTLDGAPDKTAVRIARNAKGVQSGLYNDIEKAPCLHTPCVNLCGYNPTDALHTNDTVNHLQDVTPHSSDRPESWTYCGFSQNLV